MSVFRAIWRGVNAAMGVVMALLGGLHALASAGVAAGVEFPPHWALAILYVLIAAPYFFREATK